MDNNNVWIDGILEELNEQLKQPIDSNWKYAHAFGHNYFSIGEFILGNICKDRYKEQIRNLLISGDLQNVNNDEIGTIIEQSWHDFVISFGIYKPECFLEMKKEIPYDRDNSYTWSILCSHLKRLKIDPDQLEEAIKNEILSLEDREFVKQILCILFQLNTHSISDAMTFYAFELITLKIAKIIKYQPNENYQIVDFHNFKKLEDFIYEKIQYVDAEFDQKYGLEYFFTTFDLIHKDERFQKIFFNIQGRTLPKLLIRVFDLVSINKRPIDERPTKS